MEAGRLREDRSSGSARRTSAIERRLSWTFETPAIALQGGTVASIRFSVQNPLVSREAQDSSIASIDVGKGAFFALLIIGFGFRLSVTELTIGTTDVSFWSLWAGLIEEHGIIGAYAAHPYLNHPPLALAVLRSLSLASDAAGIALGDVLRHVQSISDMVTVAMIVLVARATGSVPPARAALLFFLSPVAMFVSSFHGNTDSLLVALVACAVLLKIQQRHVSAGCVLAVATGIKILPLLLLPLFIMAGNRRARISTLAAYSVVFILLFAPVILLGGPRVISNVFFYRGFSGGWGVAGIATTLSTVFPDHQPLLATLSGLYVASTTVLIVGSWVALLIVMWRRGRALPDAGRHLQLPGNVTGVFLLILFLAPGFGNQYLLWPLPFLWFFAGRAGTAALTILYSILPLASYTVWSGSWAWWYADVLPHRDHFELTLLSLPVWIATGVILALGVGRPRPIATASPPIVGGEADGRHTVTENRSFPSRATAR